MRMVQRPIIAGMAAIRRSQAFYMELLGFQHLVELMAPIG